MAANGGWLVTGAGGMLGRELVARLRAAGAAVTAADRAALDITEPATVRSTLDAARPAVVVNCAAWTAVDEAERREAAALRVNGAGPACLARACRRVGARLLHISTDYVFDGTATIPYAEDAQPSPVNAYGRGKLAGEQAVLVELPDTGYVVRTSWLYGGDGRNFVRTMAGLAARNATADVVDDQYGQPTWTGDLARHLVLLGRAARSGTAAAGIYHASGGGETTWCGLAREVFRLRGADPDLVRPVRTADLRLPTPRPRYTVLAHGRWPAAGIPPPRHWRDGLHAAWRAGSW